MNVIDLLSEMGIQSRKTASTKGGEYHSVCPDSSCGGKDRFCIWPKEGENGRYWCRQCLKSGDAIQFCRDFLGLGFADACAKVGRLPTLRPAREPFRSRFVPQHVESPCGLWQEKAHHFIDKAHAQLIAQPHLINQDKDRGISLETMIRFKLGWNAADAFALCSEWGITTDPEASKWLNLLKGLVIPLYRDADLIRVKIRRPDEVVDERHPKYHILKGGVGGCAALGEMGRAAVLIEAELDRMLLYQVAGDICCPVVAGGTHIRVDQKMHKILMSAPAILFALDFDEAGKKAFKSWQSLYPHLYAWPVPKGKSPGDAYGLGVNLRNWILAGFKKVGIIPIDNEVSQCPIN